MTRAALTLSLLAALAASACTSSPQEDPRAALTRIATAPAGDLAVELLVEGARLETGLNAIRLRIAGASGQVVSDADVTFALEMAMSGGGSHAAPVIGTPEPGPDGVYRVDVVFPMPSSTTASWSAIVGVTRPASARVEASFAALPVVESGRATTFSHHDPDADAMRTYVASLNLREAPRVGLNSVVATLHWMEDRMTFVPVTDATMTLDPQMAGMGHGSPGSVDPRATTLGRYEGQLSFSMPGTWETTLTIARAGEPLAAPRFTTTF